MILDGFFYFEIVSNLEGVIIVQRISMSYLLRFLVVDILPSPYHFVSIFIHIYIYIFFFFFLSTLRISYVQNAQLLLET